MLPSRIGPRPKMPRMSPLVLALVLAAGPAQAQGFKFSNEDTAEKEQAAQRQDEVRGLLNTPCRDKIRNQKIVVLIGEVRDGNIYAGQGSFGQHFDAINSRLRGLGLKTYTQAQITQQIAQAEMDAYFKNDPDAAISASKRLAAQYILRGVISTRANRNALINVNQVNVTMSFTLTGANGRMISQASAENASFAGQDVSGLALTLINERADEVVARLYSDYCRAAGVR